MVDILYILYKSYENVEFKILNELYKLLLILLAKIKNLLSKFLHIKYYTTNIL